MKTMQLRARNVVCLLCLLFLVSGSNAQTTPDIVWQATATNGYVKNPLAISPDGNRAATFGTGDNVQIWQVTNGSPLVTLTGHTYGLLDLAFSPDGVYLAAGCGNGTVRVWRTADWTLAYVVSNVTSLVAFSPDSAILAVANRTLIQLHHATNGMLFHSWTATPGAVAALVFSPDGSKIASGAGIRGFDTSLNLWEVPTGALVRSIPTSQTYGIGRVAFSPDGQQVLTASDYLYSGPLQAWRVSDGSHLRTYPESVYDMDFSEDGTVLSAVGTNLMFFRASDGAIIAKYPDGYSGITPGEKGIALTQAGLFIRSRGHGYVFAGRIPILLSEPAIEDGQIFIRWVGGSGRYQLQRRSSLGEEWQNGEILTNNSAHLTMDGSAGFYRIVDLP